MATAELARKPIQGKLEETSIEYTPLGANNRVKLTIGMVRKFLCRPTKSGVQPDDAEVVRFMMLCQARELDPWVGDAFLTGYDGKHGPEFSLITSLQALLKRAEMNPNYDGLESGVSVINQKQEVVHRQGDIVYDGERLLGSWARCHRKDKKIPDYDALKLATYDKGYGRWAADPAGMIVKCSEASVLRKAFPTQLGGLYTADEMGEISEGRSDRRKDHGKLVSSSQLNEIVKPVTPVTQKLNGKTNESPEAKADEAAGSESAAEAEATSGGSSKPTLSISEGDQMDYQTALADSPDADGVWAVYDHHVKHAKGDADIKWLRDLAQQSADAMKPKTPRGRKKEAQREMDMGEGGQPE